VVLAGGRSSRMGTPKAALEWHGSTLLRRATGILARVTGGPVVVVRATGQALPALPPDVEVVDDPRPGQGPLQGIAAGLAALAGRADVAFVSATDLPFLHPAFVARVLRVLDETGADVALPVARGYPQPLAAAYRTGLAPAADRLIAAGRPRPAFLFSECAVVRLDESALRADPALAAADPALDSVLNVNDQADYQKARAAPAPEITIERAGSLAAGQRGPRPARAATVAGAAAAAGITLDRHVLAALNGDQLTRDGETPLVAGDTVLFMTADAGG
jgi:molybdenum cofactor guanylyltransferase